MRHLFIAAAIAVIPVGGMTNPVLAADVPDYYPPIIEAPEPLPLESAGGWYLRGDIGYKIYETPNGYWAAPGDYRGMTDEKLDDTGVIGLGAGYRFNDYLRLDATIDYEWAADMSGKLGCPGGCPTVESATLDAWTGLINVYADLGTYYGLTPYVGAGIGTSYLSTDDVKSSSPGDYRGDETWNFAWALMAGVGYQVTDTITVDMNYRYMNLGDAQSLLPADAGNNGTPISWDDIAAHEIRVGLRYNLY